MTQGGTGSFLLAIVFLAVYVVIWIICLIGWRVAQHRYAGKSLPSKWNSASKAAAPGISIIRPICGLDNNLFSTLESTMMLEYPKYEVIFALQDENDEAIPVVRMVMEKYGHVDAQISIKSANQADDAKIGVNPKINNIIKPFEQAKFDLIWVIDSSISVTPGTLGRAVETFLGAASPSSCSDSEMESTPLLSDDVREPPKAGDVGLVHQLPYAVVYQRQWGSLVEEAFLNTTHAKMYLAINALAIDSCIVGKSNLYSRSNIDSLTTPSLTLKTQHDPPRGLAGFSPFLAEDNMIGLALWHELHLKHAMTSDVAIDYLGSLSLRQYIDRRIRWIRVRKRMNPIIATAIEPFTESLFSGLYGTWAIDRLFGANIPVLFVVHMMLWLMVDLSVRRSISTNVRGLGPARNEPLFLLAWALREVLTLPVFLYAVCGEVVTWRGKRYKIIQNAEALCLD